MLDVGILVEHLAKLEQSDSERGARRSARPPSGVPGPASPPPAWLA